MIRKLILDNDFISLLVLFLMTVAFVGARADETSQPLLPEADGQAAIVLNISLSGETDHFRGEDE